MQQKPNPDQLVTLVHPVLRLPTAWTWMASACAPPIPGYPPVAHFISCWVEILGAECKRVYGSGQVGKILEAVWTDGLKGGNLKGDSEASRQRLGLLLVGWRDVEHHVGRNWE
jgi:nucleoporin GLE1